jgi:hypothetical protein
MKQDAFQHELLQLIDSGSPAAFEAMAFKISILVLEEGIFPSAIFTSLLAVFTEERFQLADGSWKFIRVFEQNWDRLSDRQREALLPVLEAHYESFGHWMACFVISWILGELYTDNRAFEALCRLANSQKEIPRSFVPHGFEHIASGAIDADLSLRALAELTKMQTDDSPTVRNEVAESLARLKRKQKYFPANS